MYCFRRRSIIHLGQRDLRHPLKKAASSLFFLLLFLLTLDGEHISRDTHLHIFGIQTRELSLRDEAILGFRHINRGLPFFGKHSGKRCLTKEAIPEIVHFPSESTEFPSNWPPKELSAYLSARFCFVTLPRVELNRAGTPHIMSRSQILRYTKPKW